MDKNNDIFFKKYLKYKNKYKLIGGDPKEHLIIGMGPVGLYLAIKLLEKGEKVVLVEERFLFIRKQILLINYENYNKLKNYVNIPKEEFVRVSAPPVSNDGKICNLIMDVEGSVYSIPIYKLQQKLNEYIIKNFFGKYILIKPINDPYKKEIILTFIHDDKIEFHRGIEKITYPDDINEYIPKELEDEGVLPSVYSFNFKDLKNIFLCSGGRDIISKDIYTNDLSKIFLLCPIINDKQYLTYKNCWADRDNTEIYGYGFIAFIYFKKIFLDEIRDNLDNKCNFDGFYKIKDKKHSKIFQHRYRLFISSNLINQDTYIEDPYIYLGIQFSNLEYIKGITLDYIYNCIILALYYYDLYDFIDLEITTGKLYSNYKLSDLFPIQISLIQNHIQLKSIDKSEKNSIILMGDGILKVNFFSGTGVNFGLENVDTVFSKLNKSFGFKRSFSGELDIDNNLITNDKINDTFSKSIGSLKFDLVLQSNMNKFNLIIYIIENTDTMIKNRLSNIIEDPKYHLPILELFSTFKDGPNDYSNNIYDGLIKKINIRKCSKSKR
jgi:hypothetical protein